MDEDVKLEAVAPVTELNLQGSDDVSAFEKWRERLSPLFDIRLPDNQREIDFKVGGRTWQLPSAIISDVARSGVELRRDAAFIDSNPVDHICLYFAKAGIVDVSCGGNYFQLEAGDIFVMDYRHPVFTVARNTYANATLMFTRDSCPASFRSGALHGHRLRADQPNARLLHRYLGSLLDELHILAVREADAAVQSIIALASTFFENRAAGLPDVDQVLRDRAITTIRKHIGNANLTPQMIATEVGTSRAKLYRLLEPYGGVRPLINRVRLEQSLKELASLPINTVVLSDVAFCHGFRSPAQFSRAFRARFGRSPSEILALRRDQPQAELYKAWIEARRTRPDYDTIDAWLDAIVK